MTADPSNPHLIHRARGLVQLALPVFVLCAGLALTVAGVLAMRAAEDREAQLEFVSLSEPVAKDLEVRLNTFQILARATAGMIESSQEVTRDEWLTYVEKIDPQGDWLGFRGMSYAALTKSADGQWRAPIRFIAPSNPRNDTVVGFDFMSEPLRAKAVMAACDRGDPVFTAPLVLQNDAGGRETSLVLIAPIYRHGSASSIAERREAFAGVVGTGVGIRAIVNQVTSVASKRGLALRITDLDSGTTLADWDMLPTGVNAHYSYNATLEIGGRDWLLQFESTPDYDAKTGRGRSQLMAIISLLATLLVTGALYQQRRLRGRAEQRALVMTRELRDSERELQQQLVRFSDLVELSADWFWEQDAELRFSRFWGAEAGGKDKFIGMHRWDMPIDLTPEQWSGHKAQLDARETFRYFEYPVHFGEGKRWFSVSGKPLYDEQGRFVGYRGTGTDITERKSLEVQLQRQLSRFSDLVDLSADWFWEQDADFRFTYFSSGLERSGVSVQKYLGLQRWDLPIELTPEQWAEHKALLHAHQPFRNMEYRIRRPDGSYSWFENSGVPIFENDRFVGYRGIGRNITDRKQAEEELRKYRDDLELLVAAQTADLVAAKEAAERANRAKTEFLTNMSHELRTPLHAVLAFARLGHQRAGKVEVEKLQSYFDNIRASGNQLLALVNDLLDLSRLETGSAKLAFVAIDLRQHVTSVVNELSPLLEGKQLACNVHNDIPGVIITGNPQRINQLLRNLIDNAIKFSPPGKAILIEIATANLPRGRREDDVGELPAVRLTIADEGIGIPAAELETIFDKFIQSSLTASGAGGTGLGLAICREIVHAHRGMIHARNRDEGGAAFEVLLPLAHGDNP
ncbi:MAG: CHASE domain-containing protein [Pseudomonadota bacterium]